MKLRHVLAICLLAAIITVAAVYTLLAIDFSISREADERVEYLFFVDETIGFDVESDLLRLGAVTPGGSATRSIHLQHPTATTAQARFIGEGNNWLYAQEASFEEGVAQLKITLAVPIDAAYGEYRGEVLVYVR